MRYLACGLLLILLIMGLGCETTATNVQVSTVTSSNPTGTYSGIIFGLKQTITFDGNKLSFYDEINGKIIYEFAWMRDGELIVPDDAGKVVPNQILLRDHAMGIQRVEDYKYLPADKCVVIAGQRYYK